MTKLEQKLKATLQRLGIENTPSLLVAVSGGADSVSLLDALERLNKCGKLPARILIAHLNHQLRGEESDEDEAFVIQLARQNNLEYFVEHSPVAEIMRNEKANLEATARRLRYEFLARAAQACSASFVLTAHTQDDQAETILMRLLRGSGAEGLRGIRPIRQLGQSVELVRPMLTVTRAEVIEHCERYHLKFRTDSSNTLPDFTRNRIRQELLPLMKSFNPRSDEALTRMADLLAEDHDVLHQIALNVLTKARKETGLSAKTLREQVPAIRRRVLRLWLEEERGGLQRIEAVHVKAIEQLILRNHGGRVIELPGDWRVLLKSGILIAHRLRQTP
ncbi:MAG: tRNA lysidine(34) synthetase TilS [Acidobacteriota bacterium]|nr:tRNA lysidine(34) synthetase TilS [Acidobacteriota bacterium]